jgi:hypothetical protein
MSDQTSEFVSIFYFKDECIQVPNVHVPTGCISFLKLSASDINMSCWTRELVMNPISKIFQAIRFYFLLWNITPEWWLQSLTKSKPEIEVQKLISRCSIPRPKT